MFTSGLGAQIQTPYTDAQAWEGQWGLRFRRVGARIFGFQQVGPHLVPGTAESGAFALPGSSTLAGLIDLDAQNAMDAAGLSTGAAISASPSTTYHVYYCRDGDFAGGAGFSTTAPALVGGMYLLGSAGVPARCFFLGWVRLDSGANMQDNAAQRLTVNYYNRRWKTALLRPGYNDNNAATTFSANLAAWGRLNGGTGDTFEYVANGEDRYVFQARVTLGGAAPATGPQFGLGDNSNTEPTVVCTIPALDPAGASTGCGLDLAPAAGYRTVALLGMTNGLATTIQADLARNGAAADPAATWMIGAVPT